MVPASGGECMRLIGDYPRFVQIAVRRRRADLFLIVRLWPMRKLSLPASTRGSERGPRWSSSLGLMNPSGASLPRSRMESSTIRAWCTSTTAMRSIGEPVRNARAGGELRSAHVNDVH